MTDIIYDILDCCSEFINNIDDFEEVGLGTDFMCYPTTNEIYIAVLASEISVDNFRDYLYTQTSIRTISEFTWSLLHEVGHCMTWHSMNKRTINHCRNIKRKIIRGSIPKPVYYTLTDEKIATNWAIQFVENNFNKVQNFDNKILKMLDLFYVENIN